MKIKWKKNAYDVESFLPITETTVQQINVHCRQCSKIGHYASVCRNQSEVRKLKYGNFLGSIIQEKVNSVKGEEELEWHTKIKVTTKVCSKIINFRLDTSTDVTAIPFRFFKRISQLYESHIKDYMNWVIKKFML